MLNNNQKIKTWEKLPNGSSLTEEQVLLIFQYKPELGNNQIGGGTRFISRMDTTETDLGTVNNQT